MAKLPDLDLRWVPVRKIRDFALCDATPKARERHAFFTSYGFTRTNWAALRVAVMAHAEVYDAEVVRKDEYGTTHAATGAIASPDGRNPVVTAYWIMH